MPRRPTRIAEAEPKPKKKTRRGSRGGRRRRKTSTAASAANGAAPDDDGPRIHVPDRSLEEEPAPEPAEAVAAETNGAEPAAEGDEAPKPKKKTRRGSRGGKRRRKTTTAAAPAGGDAPEPTESAA